MKNKSLFALLGILLLTSCGKEDVDATSYVGRYCVAIKAPYEFEYFRTAHSRYDTYDTITVQLAEDKYSVTVTGKILSGSGRMNDEHALIIHPTSDTISFMASVGIMDGLTGSGRVKMALAHPEIVLQPDSTHYEATISGSIRGELTGWEGENYGSLGAPINGTAQISIRRL